jgi:4-amino-4-deoxy-L-arabinose transferase-like glycosyltransferase
MAIIAITRVSFWPRVAGCRVTAVGSAAKKERTVTFQPSFLNFRSRSRAATEAAADGSGPDVATVPRVDPTDPTDPTDKTKLTDPSDSSATAVSTNGAAPVEGTDPVAAGDPVDPPWARPALAALLLGTAIAYLWNLSINGWGNSFYAAAVQAGTMSWKAFFFGSFDPANYITVDKPPVSLWIMALSGRIFGFNSWSMLAPEALLGVASVALLYLTVRRVWGAPAGLLAGLTLAVTPVATLMFRFNNPDAALTFLMVAAAYTMTRALERASTRWLLATGALMGLAFLTKELQAMLVAPGLALAYLVAAPAGIVKRVGQLLATGVTMAVTGLWWMVVVDLLPASSRPYVGGSTDNSVLGLALGYNGLGRLTGDEATGLGSGPGGLGGPGGGGGPGGPGGGGPSGGAEIGRLLNAEFGGFTGWLIPAAIIGAVVALWLTRRAGRTDTRRASLILWAGWFVVTAAVFSFSKGIIHTYYGIALAPAVAALAGMTLPTLWRLRSALAARVMLALICAATATTAYLLLDRTPAWLPWVRWTVLVAGLVVAVGLVAVGTRRSRFGGRAMVALAAMGVVSAIAVPAAWSVATIGTARTGPVPGVGPAQAQSGGFGRGNPFAGGQLPAGIELPEGVTLDELREQFSGAPGAPGGAAGPGGQGPGGGEAETVDAALVTLLRTGSSNYTWAAAARSSDLAAPLQLSSNEAVMSLGGFGGMDQAITLDTFKQYVSDHKVHYFVSGGSRGGGGIGGGRAQTDVVSAIDTWVTSAFTAKTIGNYTVYDLSAPK